MPVRYSTQLLRKWIDYDCGNGLWYYFNHKYNIYKDDLRLQHVASYYQEEIVKACYSIDKERYANLAFGEELLSKVGTQLTEEILPKLVRLQTVMERKLPAMINYLFIVAGILIIFGIVIPVLIKIFALNPLFDIASISIVLATCFYVLVSFYSFMKKENKVI